MTPQAGIGVFSVISLAVVAGIARRDAVIGGFVFFFFVYAIFSLVGYAFYPILSAALGAYFGDEVLVKTIWFLCLSFLCLFVVFQLGWRSFRSLHPIEIEFRPRGMVRLVAVAATALLLSWVGILFLQNYRAIRYAAEFPGFWLQFLFKELPVTAVVLYAAGRRHVRKPQEARLLFALATAATVLVIVIASRSGNRTDVLALMLGIVSYEAYAFVVGPDGGVKLDRTALVREWRTILFVGTVVVLAVAIMSATQVSRARGLVGVPRYASLIYNDYFAPAHMLLGAIALHWIRPVSVLASNVANLFYVGRVLDIPYLQQDLGNVLMPGSSNRSFSFAYYIFTEGYMAAGWWGVLYNGIVPLMLLIPFRLLSRTSSASVNALGAAIAMMFVANVARSQTALIPRYFLTNAVPAVLLFCALTGLRRRSKVAS